MPDGVQVDEVADARTARRLPISPWVVGGMALAVAGLLLVGGLWSVAWGNGLRGGQQLFPGTAIAGVEVGGVAVEEARASVDAAVQARLDQPLTVQVGDRTWSATPRDLGATSDLDVVVDAAWASTRDAGVLDLARRRFGLAGGRELDVSLAVPEEALGAWVAGMATAVDVHAVPASVTWVDGAAVVRDAVVGRALDRTAAAETLRAAIADGTSEVVLDVADSVPSLTTEQARAVAADVETRVAAALDRPVHVTLTDVHGARAASRMVTGREVGAATNAARVLAARGQQEVRLQVSRDRVHEVVDEIVMPNEVPAVDAVLSWTREAGFTSVPGSTGQRIDHAAATNAVADTLESGGEVVSLTLEVSQPAVDQGDFDEVLLVRQADREVDLVQAGQVVRTWQVAVGTSGYPTPTGQFTIGAKRFEPTWINPDPTDWGRNMPARIGPSPSNPLGLRALNWLDPAGHDTLIRFHGTQNAASIGQAASHGCVRMTNPDVVELYDLVETGTVVLSVL